jgi:hypothetical protein
MKINLSLFIAVFLFNSSFAQKITGNVTGVFNEPLSFSSIIVKGSSVGVPANDSGRYSIDLKPGTYVLQCEHVGYETAEKQVTITSQDTVMNFKLETVQYHLKEVIVHSGAEDPAYEIIRNAIKLRDQHDKELKKFQCRVYIKGVLQLRHYPKRFLGNDVDFGDADTSQKKIIFLSETVATYSVDRPESKIEVTSTKVSGNSDGFGFGAPQIISFYDNNVRIGKNLNPRGFISPIADNALSYYTYKFVGTFLDNGKMIDKIEVTPRRKFEPLFSGTINIIEDEWRIYSVQLTLLKAQQLQVLDTLKIEQLYVPANGIWLIKQQNIYPSVNLFGFDAFGSFVQVYDKFDMEPEFAKNYFGTAFLKYDDSSNKKPNSYWDSTRPIPLHANEIADYKRKDSLEKIHNTVRYMDSLDRKNNKIKPLNLFLIGQTFNITRQKFSIAFEPVFDEINYNTVEGIEYNFSPHIQKTFKNKQSLTLTPTLRYGFNNHHFNAHLTGIYDFNKKKEESLFFSGGQRVIQYNSEGNITPRFNSISTLFDGVNYMKIYQMRFAKIGYKKTFDNGFSFSVSPQFQDRYPLENTTLYSAAKSAQISFTPDYPVELADMNMPHNKAFTTTIDLNWKPGVKYIEFPDSKINIGSKYPTFDLAYTQGINGWLGSNVDYSKWQLGVSQNINMHIAGRFAYNVNFGGFFNATKVFLPDYQQFIGNQVVTAADYLKSFQLMNYYQYSTIAPFYTEAHVEYHLNGLLSNKIPVFQKLNWFFVIGSNALYTTDTKAYAEIFFSIENIFKIGRIDFIQAFGQNGYNTSGITFSLSGLINSHREN